MLTRSFIQIFDILVHKVVFTDIDGTMIDINTGEYGETPNLVRILAKNGIPVILCSAKTWAEQNQVRTKIGLDDPFIVENGGAIVIRNDFFMHSYLPTIKRVKDYNIIELGKTADKVREKLRIIREKSNVDFKSVGDISIEELSRITNLSLEYATTMAQRQYGETILQIKSDDLVKFTNLCFDIGLNVIHGGRFFDVTMGNDKGKAVDILIGLFRRKYNDDVMFFGIGDSQNDAPMLDRMDVPMLVQRFDGSWSDLGLEKIIKVNAIGPKGWSIAFNKILD
jgi:mannosyl-3-phosphoglycerate phosphatase family protein